VRLVKPDKIMVLAMHGT